MSDAVNGMILETLQAHNEQAEIWWDSLPTSFGDWKDRLVASAPAERKAVLAEQLARFWDPSGEAESLVRGCTTNPRLVHEGLMLSPEAWASALRTLARQHGTTDPEAAYRLLYREIFRRNAAMLLPLWERSEGRHGWVCAQLLPTLSFEVEAMVAQGQALAEAASNVMVKVVGSEQGYQAIEQLTSLGIATNSTLSFSVPQVMRCLEALGRGLDRARRNGVDLSRWRAVITYMIGRVGAEPALFRQAESQGVSLSPQDVRWAEVAIAGRLYRLIESQGHRIKLLFCSLKLDPWQETPACFHLEKSRGMDCVYTCSPPFLDALLAHEGKLALRGEGFEEPVPEGVLERLLRIPLFRAAYSPEGIPPEEFHLQPAFARGLDEATAAYHETLGWIRTTLAQEETHRA